MLAWLPPSSYTRGAGDVLCVTETYSVESGRRAAKVRCFRVLRDLDRNAATYISGHRPRAEPDQARTTRPRPPATSPPATANGRHVGGTVGATGRRSRKSSPAIRTHSRGSKLTLFPRFLISTHYTRYDYTLFALNFAALIFVLFPKLPLLHRLRFHFLNFDGGPTPAPSRPASPGAKY